MEGYQCQPEGSLWLFQPSHPHRKPSQRGDQEGQVQRQRYLQGHEQHDIKYPFCVYRPAPDQPETISQSQFQPSSLLIHIHFIYSPVDIIWHTFLLPNIPICTLHSLHTLQTLHALIPQIPTLQFMYSSTGLNIQKIPSVFTEVIIWGELIGGGIVFSCK